MEICIRAFLSGVWDLFDNSADEAQAREALARLKRLPVERDYPGQFEQVVSYLEEHFDGSSLAEFQKILAIQGRIDFQRGLRSH